MHAQTEQPSAYIPRDRRQAILDGATVPQLLQGCALFADISGFTPLTEALANELGPQRGVEQLTIHLNDVFDALIMALHEFGGAVIGFSGDAITCWFTDDNGLRATACALEMQERMQRFEAVTLPSGKQLPLAIKVAVAAGNVQRFVVGIPEHRLIDVAAGKTLENLADAEHQAKTGEVIVDNVLLDTIGSELFLSEIRTEIDKKFGVLTALRNPVAPRPWSDASATALDITEATPWLLPPVARQLAAGNGDFLAELRPAVALFVRFTGIAYDEDPQAPEKLNTFIVGVQEQLNRYEGSLIQLTIGDKGSYLYAAFGAPIAHQDDAARAANTAINIRALANELPYIEDIQLGITRGRMRTGAYGGQNRRTYGVLGDMVNLSARLMTNANIGEILITDQVQRELGTNFDTLTLDPIMVKGKTAPIAIARLVGKRKAQNGMLRQTDQLAMPLLGRSAELSQLQTKLMQAARGKGQVVAITGEAGLGKTMLVSAFLRQLPEGVFKILTGETEAWGKNDAYRIWEDVWRTLFELTTDLTYDAQVSQLDMMLSAMDPGLLSRLPLLGSVVNLSIPDNQLTSTFDAKLRRTALESLLISVLTEATKKRPMVIVLEDLQWIDELSAQLLNTIATAISALPVMLICVERSTNDTSQTNKLRQLLHYSELGLLPFSNATVADFISYKLKRMGTQPLPAQSMQTLTTFISERTNGNPFFIDEIFNYLTFKNIDVTDLDAVTNLDLPGTVHSLMLSRIDQLAESQQSTLKVASVIGRLFRALVVKIVMPNEMDQSQLGRDLEQLVQNELTLIDNGPGELTYLFRNLVTQEVAYNNLPFATRARLHERIGSQVEAEFSDNLDLYLDLLAYHYNHTDNNEKKRYYLLAAADKAERDYSNQAALAYLQQALPLVEDANHFGVLRRIGKLHELHASWDAAKEYYGHAQTVAEKQNAGSDLAWAQLDQADLHRKRGEYSDAETLLEQVRSQFTDLDDQEGIGQTLHIMGTLAAQSGNLDQAGMLYRESLTIREALGDKKNIGALLSNLGIVARYNGDYDEARSLYEQSLVPRRELGDKWAISVSLSNLGNVALDQKDFATAKSSLEQGLQMLREVGDRQYTALNLNNLANVQRDMEDYAGARKSFGEGLRLNRELGDKWGLVYLLEDISIMHAKTGKAEQSIHLFGAATALRETIKTPRTDAEQAKLETGLAPAHAALATAMVDHLLDQGQTADVSEIVAELLTQFQDATA